MKMSTTTKDIASHIEENLYHYGLIRIILNKVLKKKKKMWGSFPSENHLMEDEKDSSPS